MKNSSLSCSAFQLAFSLWHARQSRFARCRRRNERSQNNRPESRRRNLLNDANKALGAEISSEESYAENEPFDMSDAEHEEVAAQADSNEAVAYADNDGMEDASDDEGIDMSDDDGGCWRSQQGGYWRC